MIQINTSFRNDIEAHSVSDYPHECCGAMLGSFDSVSGKKIVEKLIRIDNHWTATEVDGEDKRRRFAIRPEDYRSVEKSAADLGMTLLGFYHSHPDHPAKPSQTDLNYAWPFFSYVIQSVFDGVPKEMCSYVLDGDGFVEEKIVVV